MFCIIRVPSKVETQNFASHKQGGAINGGEDMSAVTAFFPRETQGGAINGYGYIPAVVAFFARETQNFASLQADAIDMA